MEEDKEVTITLGRCFLVTGRTIIDAANEDLTMRVHDKEVNFNIFKAIKYHISIDDCLRVDLVQQFVNEELLASKMFFRYPSCMKLWERI